MSTAVSTTKVDRIRAEKARICRRDHRSMKTPANGPISEYGRYRTTNAAAPRAGFGNVVALKKTYVPTPAVKMPSPVWEISLVANRRRKFRSASTATRSVQKFALAGRPPDGSGGLVGGPPGPPASLPVLSRWRPTHPA